MTRDDVRDLMYDYFDGHLSEEENNRVRSFLEEYDNVAEEYKQFHRLLERVKHLPSGINIPKDLIPQISEELLSLSVAEHESDKQRELRRLTEGHKPESDSGKTKKYRSDGKRTVVPFSIKTVLLVLLAAALCIAVVLFLL